MADPRPLEASFPAPEPIDLRLTLAALRHGPDDPTIRFGPDGVWLARRTGAGAATLRLWADGAAGLIRAESWGPGAVPALEAAPGLAGLLDDPSLLAPRHPLVRELQRRFPGLRLPRTGQLIPALVPAVIEQKVTAGEAHAAYSAIVRRYGEAAPGPADLMVAPAGLRLAALPYFEFHPLGLERRRAELVALIGRRESEIEALMALPSGDAFARLQSTRGIGPWTAAEATRAAFGDPDAVSLGDAHLPDLVSWALAGEPRSDDARMLELLAPYQGQRARVVRLLEVAGIAVPRRGPRFAPRRIGRI
ncbi:MAG: DNA-3-methyladenine glycosylase family protein [Candidatus Limnocylindrales bacterium]